MTKPGTTHFNRILLVEAKNRMAVQAMERLVAVDGSVSATCQLLAIMRSCGNIGIRSDSVEEITLVDFLLDIVDPQRLQEDELAANSFSSSFSADEVAYFQKKAAMMKQVIQATSETSKKTKKVDESGKAAHLAAALKTLGFLKGTVEKYVKGLPKDRFQESIEKLIAKGCQDLSPSKLL